MSLGFAHAKKFTGGCPGGCIQLEVTETLVVELGVELSLQTSFMMSSSATAWYNWLYNNIPVNQCQVFRASSVFYFSDYSLILCYSSCFCLLFPLRSYCFKLMDTRLLNL